MKTNKLEQSLTLVVRDFIDSVCHDYVKYGMSRDEISKIIITECVVMQLSSDALKQIANKSRNLN